MSCPPDPPAPAPPAPSRWSAATPGGRAARVGAIAALFGLLVACGVPLCPFAIVTRHPCPGCGLTRATLALAQGHVAEALHFHPLSPIMAPLVIAAIAYNAAVYVKDGRIAATEAMQGAWVTRLGVALAVLMVTVWVARFLGAFGGPVPV
ncbi:DUF2752 domain-containing protein [Sorangium cellulosum]|uniref:DUF2752 domain-containing protein n=1 Tax=Sorangium cellulosum TaxID=56 RepID=A0A150QDC4_SORCE|nr:DUF2752 domain-containing protein [Sorangium cellulosum]KYF65970.1 hypothetical protein BE15_03670 [Sorangium cellulosum]